MSGATIPAGASADHTHWCPGGCNRRVPHRYFACGDCWVRLPFEYQQPIQIAYRHDDVAHAKAMVEARGWYQLNPPEPGRATLAEQLKDLANMLAGIGRHADHTRSQAGRCVVCSCGVRVQGRLT